MVERKARSVRIHQFGGPEVLRIEDVVVGAPGLGEGRLNIRAFGINRTEITLRSGRSPLKPSLPTSIGWEAAGVIDEVGEDVEDWHPGDRVTMLDSLVAESSTTLASSWPKLSWKRTARKASRHSSNSPRTSSCCVIPNFLHTGGTRIIRNWDRTRLMQPISLANGCN